jgi:hypothetical protein
MAGKNPIAPRYQLGGVQTSMLVWMFSAAAVLAAEERAMSIFFVEKIYTIFFTSVVDPAWFQCGSRATF